MKIESLKELDKLILLCQRRGVESVTIDNISFKLSDSPPQRKTQPRRSSFVSDVSLDPTGVQADTKIKIPDELTPDQLLMWSVDSNEAM